MLKLFSKLDHAIERLFTWGTKETATWKANKRAGKENLCCRFLKVTEFISLIPLNIIMLRVNYCFVCGRKITRQHASLQAGKPAGEDR